MRGCKTCHFRDAAYKRADLEFVSAARKAARSDTPRNLAVLERRRTERDRTRESRDQHASECDSGTWEEDR